MVKIGLLNKNMTLFMNKNNVIDVPIKERNQQGIYTLSMLYDFWLIYIYENDLIRNQYIYPDDTINNLLYSQYDKYGGSVDGYLISTFLRILESQISFDSTLLKNVNLKKQADILRLVRSGYII